MAIEAICIRELVVAPENIRKIVTPVDDLVASIAAHGLLQNLVAYRDGDGRVAVTAGGRRTRALLALADDKAIKAYRPTTRVPVDIREQSDALREISLAENTLRVANHPLDESQAYADIVDAGGTVGDIARRFAQTERHVESRLRLGRLCPEVRDAYRAGTIALDHARAFTVTPSHEVQREALAAYLKAPNWNRDPHHIRGLIAQGKVRPNDRLARFVTLEAYLAAGGEVLRDLFSQNGTDVVALADSGLLNRLAQAKLTERAESIADQGWKWIETSVEPADWDVLGQYERVEPLDVPLSEADTEQLAALEARADAVASAVNGRTDPDSGEDLSDERLEELHAEHARLDDAIETIRARTSQYTDEDRARSGVIVCISYAGELALEEGLIRVEDLVPEAGAGSDDAGDDDRLEPGGSTPITSPSVESEARAAEKEAGLSQVLVADLGGYRQQILKAAVAAHPETALDLVLHAMVCGLFSTGWARTPFSATFEKTQETVSASDLDDTVAGAELKALAEALPIIANRPSDPVELFDAVRALEQEVKLRLLAYCTAMTLKVGLPSETTKAQRLVDHVGAILGVDVATYWRPTEQRYFTRVKKAHLLEVLDAVGFSKLARQMASGKKDPIVKGVAAIFDPATRPVDVVSEEQTAALDTWLPPGMAFAPMPDTTVAAEEEGVSASEPSMVAAE